MVGLLHASKAGIYQHQKPPMTKKWQIWRNRNYHIKPNQTKKAKYMYTETLTQRLALAAGDPPFTMNNTRHSTDGIDMLASHKAIFVLSIGANAGSISAWLQESADNSSWTANDSAGAFANSGAANVSQTGLTTANKIYTFEVRADQLTTGKRYVRLQIKEVNSANVITCVTAWGDEGVHKPNNANNASAVTTQNVVA
jgi:hypothetical protein